VQKASVQPILAQQVATLARSYLAHHGKNRDDYGWYPETIDRVPDEVGVGRKAHERQDSGNRHEQQR
jgi:hypothetical protein